LASIRGEGREGRLSAIDRFAWPVWVFLLVTIPFTSHPWVAAVTGPTGVSPLSGIPLALLAVTWLPGHLWKRRQAPKSLMLLLGFLVAALLSSAMAFFLPILPLEGTGLLSRGFRSMSTLVMGIAFFALAALFPRTEDQLRATLRWIFVGAAILLLYSTFEVSRIPDADNPVPQNIVDFHRLFSIRDPQRARVSGFAYEPSWLGNQLVMLYIPLFLASVYAGYGVITFRGRRVPLEWGLLAWSLVVLFFAFARLAWVSAILMAVAVALLGWRKVAGQARLRRGRAGGDGHPNRAWIRRAAQALLLLTVVLLVGVAVFGAGSTIDNRLESLFHLDLRRVISDRHPWPYLLATQLRYVERLMYWIAGFRIFSLYPLFGIGLGNAAFLMPLTVPPFAFYLPETIASLHLGAYGLPNTKSLWIRILAETGILGFSLFAAWIVDAGTRAALLFRQTGGLARMLGLAGLLTLLALAIEGFSLDTFALPQLWMVLGLAVAASRLKLARPDPVEA